MSSNSINTLLGGLVDAINYLINSFITSMNILLQDPYFSAILSIVIGLATVLTFITILRLLRYNIESVPIIGPIYARIYDDIEETFSEMEEEIIRREIFGMS